MLLPSFSTRVSISDTTISTNRGQINGLYYSSSANVNSIVMTRLLVDNAGNGIILKQENGSLHAGIIDSVVSHNNFGVSLGGGIYAIIDNSRIVKNYGGFGIEAGTATAVFLSRSTIFGNEHIGISHSGNVYSYGDNRIHANAIDISGGSLATAITR